MAEFPVPLDNLIAYVKTLHPDGGPLDNVSDAFAVSARLDEQSDALIGYFVDQARKSGVSWSQIGGAMGVSKQAAQKRFVPGRLSGIAGRGQTFSRFTLRARNVLAAAGRLVEEESGEAAVGAAELTAALLTEPEGIAAKVILRAGLTAEQVYAAVGAGPAPAVADTSADDLQELAFSESGKETLKGAVKTALRYSHNYIGTEHLLLGTLAAGGQVADAIGALGLTPETAEQLVAAEFAAVQEQRRQSS
jgi:Clp amino terminal domain, pathogenicity island component